MYQSMVRLSRTGRLACAGLAMAAAIALGAEAATSKKPIAVVVDQAKLVRIESPAHTVIVGNPAIADATVFDPNTLVITGRSYGTTNLIVLDEKGKPIADEVLSVAPPQTTTVQIHRRDARFTFSCDPNCAPALAPGDYKEFFEKVNKQLETRNKMSKSSATDNN